MKRLIINVFAIVLLMVISFGTRAQSKDVLKDVVAKMNQEMMDLVKAGKYEELEKFYDKDVIYLPNYKVAAKGYEQVLAANMQKKNSGYNVIDGQKNTTEIFVNGDLLVDVGTFTMTVNLPSYGTSSKDYGKYINVWKKDKEGNWKIVAETWNTNKNNMIGPSQVQGKQDGEPTPAVQSPTGNATDVAPAQGTTIKSSTEEQPSQTGTGTITVPAQSTTPKSDAGTQPPVNDIKNGKK